MTKIFISYKRGTDGVKKLAKDLQKTGYSIWVDVERIYSGDDWKKTVADNINSSDVFVVCLTPDAINSENVLYEVQEANRKGLIIMPLLFQEIADLAIGLSQLELPLTYHIEKFTSIDMWDESLDKLINSLLEKRLFPVAERNLLDFEKILARNTLWTEEYWNDKPYWIYDLDPLYQITIQYDSIFDEKWTRVYPDKSANKYIVNMLIQGVIVKRVYFVSCDGGRVFVPMPKIKEDSDDLVYFYDASSVEFKLGCLIGNFYIYNTLEGVAKKSGIKIEQ